MQTSLDCLPCFMRQALSAARIATDSPALQQQILHRAARLLAEFDLGASPPENAVALYRMIAETSGRPDPYRELKEESTRIALDLLPLARARVDEAGDPLLAAIKFAIAGNIIDYGAHQDFDARRAIDNCLAQPLAINDYDQFRQDAARAASILYLADNCGEIVFDGLLIEQLGAEKITVAVKERPIINDALVADARACGLDRRSSVISNGTDCPGTPLADCAGEFLDRFHGADLIISKGQGNFESLSESDAPIYFLLTVKCPVVAEHVGALAGDAAPRRAAMGDLILMKKARPFPKTSP